ncbi:lysostaphin resistance A-like protein [Natrarchaeobius sp. A-rgal3]|uniref:lysostaphin resistance A-like protein n=1 Tax=Natrarchaeobius versutus TaxID=1679078 RepID=UPI003510120B
MGPDGTTSDSPGAGGSVAGDRLERVRPIAVVIALVAGAYVAQIGFARSGIDVTGPLPSLGWYLVSIAAPFAVASVAYFAYRGSITVPIRRPTRTEAATVVGGIVAAYLVYTVYVIVVTTVAPSFAHFGGEAESPMDGISSVAIGLVYVLVFSIVTVFLEELFFRGVLQGYLQNSIGPLVAIGVASVCFAWFHVYFLSFASPAFVGGMVYYTAMGTVFGVVYERTRNLTVPFLVHAGFNAGPFLIVFATMI